jgi:hypothetical protein
MEMESNPLTNFIYPSTKEIHNQKKKKKVERDRATEEREPEKRERD